MDRYGMGWLYFDFYGGYSAPDWGDGRVTQSTDFMYFDRSMRRMLGERDAMPAEEWNISDLFVNPPFSHLAGALSEDCVAYRGAA